MIITPFKNSIFASRNPISIFSLSSALHQWSYQKATIDGTTMTAEDFGSVGGWDMSNPTALSLPTLNEDNASIDFDGINDILIANMPDFRVDDSTGVFHFRVNHVDGVTSAAFTSSSNLDANNLMSFVINIGNLPQSLINVTGTNYITRSTTQRTGDRVITIIQDGVELRMLEGASEIPYSLSGYDTRWFNTLTDRTNIAIGGSNDLTPFYSAVQFKYAAYCPYVDFMTAVNEAQQILNSTQFTEIT